MSCHFRNSGRNPLAATPPTSLTYILSKLIVRTRVELAEKLLKRLLRYFGKYRFYSNAFASCVTSEKKLFFGYVEIFDWKVWDRDGLSEKINIRHRWFHKQPGMPTFLLIHCWRMLHKLRRSVKFALERIRLNFFNGNSSVIIKCKSWMDGDTWYV